MAVMPNTTHSVSLHGSYFCDSTTGLAKTYIGFVGRGVRLSFDSLSGTRTSLGPGPNVSRRTRPSWRAYMHPRHTELTLVLANEQSVLENLQHFVIMAPFGKIYSFMPNGRVFKVSPLSHIKAMTAKFDTAMN